MYRATALAALVACASGFELAAVRPMRVSAFSAARAPSVVAPVAQRSSRAVMMAEEEVSPQESAIAVALTGAFLGIYVFDNIITAGVLAALASYLTTTDSQAGDIATSTGAFGFKTYKSIVKFAQEKDLLPKAKTVTDKVVSALQAVDNNYGITAKIDEKLLISDKVSAATDKLAEVKSTVTSKVDELSASLK
ncbi:hypothetical protein KFE25_005929 [Diacronema lutheri]|uniref:Uncharacterized protein n=1 Tax=Diacronema lutheri TaxID=2081491 RepID=A0A8J5Y166_DIALT|nr:hypothetical protein KFE25_005929 [Diacronema lutheri]